MSAFGNAVLIVFLLASQRHVIDVAAGRVVTEVENDERLSSSLVNGDRSMNGFPCDPVGILHFSSISDTSMPGFVELSALKDLTGTVQEVRAWPGFQFAVQSVFKGGVVFCHENDPLELLGKRALACWVQVQQMPARLVGADRERLSHLFHHCRSSPSFWSGCQALCWCSVSVRIRRLPVRLSAGAEVRTTEDEIEMRE